MKIIQLQLYLAKRSAKRITSRSTPIEVEMHINHSLDSLNHLVAHISSYKAIIESKRRK